MLEAHILCRALIDDNPQRVAAIGPRKVTTFEELPADRLAIFVCHRQGAEVFLLSRGFVWPVETAVMRAHIRYCTFGLGHLRDNAGLFEPVAQDIVFANEFLRRDRYHQQPRPGITDRAILCKQQLPVDHDGGDDQRDRNRELHYYQGLARDRTPTPRAE